MKGKLRVFSALITIFIMVFPANSLCQRSKQGILKAGAAKIDITPADNELPENYEGVHDRIHSRAIVVDNGVTSACLISVDAGGLSDELWLTLTGRLEKELGIPSVNVFITATHTHSVPFNPGNNLADKIFACVKQAGENLQPARMAYGTGVSYINVNRNIIDPETRRWWEGPNYDGPSDKTVAVITFETLDGKPIAVYYNYAVHAVITGQLDMVSGDIPGATSKYIEDSFGNEIVAVWSTGAAGDQNPVYFQQTYDLREIRIKEYASRGIDISNSMPSGGQGLNKQDPVVIRLMNQQKQMILSMGQMLGEEVLHVMRGHDYFKTNISIYGDQNVVSCPGRRRTNTGRAGYPGTYEDADSVSMRLSLLLIDNIAITAVNGEVFNLIAQRLKQESPYANTMMVTLTNGRANTGYIPNDAAFGYNTFEVLSSRLQPGYAEDAIVKGLLSMIRNAGD